LLSFSTPARKTVFSLLKEPLSLPFSPSIASFVSKKVGMQKTYNSLLNHFTFNANFDAAYVLWQARVGDIAAMWLTMWGGSGAGVLRLWLAHLPGPPACGVPVCPMGTPVVASCRLSILQGL
jgi:hypothetical protein